MTAKSDHEQLMVEDFAGGLRTERWQQMSAGPFTADDGRVATTRDGMSVAPKERHPATGEPMFTKDGPGVLGHLKWLVTTRQPFPTDTGPLHVTFRAGARCFGMAGHPYGNLVDDPGTDVRLGAGTLNVLDFESGLVFDFWLGHSTIVPFYERLLPPEGVDHQAFSSVSDPVPCTPGSSHDLSITVDAAEGEVRWHVDGIVVASVGRLGVPAQRWTTVLDHGGAPVETIPRRLHVGMGLMTLLDASSPTNSGGLVSLGERLLTPTTFHGGPTLFGQGVELTVRRVTVESDREER